jgi:hypothetical protein
MKFWAWLLIGFGIVGISFWLIVVTHAHLIPVVIFVAIDVVATLGSFWMMYVALHEEKQPWPMFWLAFVPFSSLWYYFQPLRPRRLRSLAPPIE